MKKIWKDEDRAMQCAQFLVDYLNAETYDEAYRGIQKGVVSTFGFFLPGYSRSKDKPAPLHLYSKIEEGRAKLKELLLDLEKGIRLRESEALEFFVSCYEDRKVTVKVHDDNSITEKPLFARTHDVYYDEIPQLYAILAYCVITSFKSEKMRRLICKCENPECGKYYIPERDKKKKGAHKFCCDACRSRKYYLRKKQSKADKKKQK